MIGLRVGLSSMNFANESNWDLEGQTQSDRLSPARHNSSHFNEYLVVVRMNRQFVKVFRPQEKNLTFGRSSRCTITLPDPRFSRTAGELILGPVPILKWTGDRKKSVSLVSIEPGKPYRIRPYTLTVMEPGDFIFNRYKTNHRSLFPLLKYLIFILAILTIVSVIFLRSHTTDEAAVKTTARSILTGPDKQKVKKIMHESGNINKDRDMETRILLSSDPSHEELMAVPKSVSFDSAPASNGKGGVVTKTQQRPEKNKMGATMPDGELQQMIKTALLLIERGDLVMAGRTLSPLLPHMDNDQRALIVDKIDPPIEALFLKAYMIKFYEPDEARRILLSIIDGELELLPSYQKAKRLLEEEQPGHLGFRIKH